jgi:hypothetical protein
MHATEESPTPARSPVFVRGGGLFDNRELSTIAMIAALHFVVSFVARLSGTILFVFLGPYYVFLNGIGDEGIPCLLIAVIVTLIPRFGTAALTIITVFLLNGIVSGSFSAAAATYVLVSVVCHEAVLLLCGVTHRRRVESTAASASTSLLVRTALAVGLANGAALYGQFMISIKFYDFHFDTWYLYSVALIAGMGYGAIGAVIGTLWGFQLRKTSP